MQLTCMKDWFWRFRTDEPGALTVDFVVLTAAICTLGLLVVIEVSGDATDLTNEIENFLLNIEF